MMTKLLATAAALVLAVPAWAEITIEQAYARSATPNAMAGAAFMMIMNDSDSDDRLIRASSPAAKRVEIHTHKHPEGSESKASETGSAGYWSRPTTSPFWSRRMPQYCITVRFDPWWQPAQL